MFGVVRARSILAVTIWCLVAGVALRFGAEAVVNGSAARMARLVAHTVEDSYSSQVGMYASSGSVSISPLGGGEATPRKTVGLSAPAGTLTDRFLESALEYKLQTTRARSQRLEELQRAPSSGSAAEDQDTVDVQGLMDLLMGARTKEEDAERIVSQSGLGRGVASMSESGLRVFVARALAAGTVAVLGQSISDATGLSLEKITIAQRSALP